MESALVSKNVAIAPTDSIVAACQRGDRAAFDLLFERFHPRIYALALGILGRENEAEDVVQDTFIKMYQNIDRFEGRSSFETWLVSIAVNCCRDRIRRRSLRQFLSLDNLAPALLHRILRPGAGAAGDPAAAVVQQERQRSLWQAVAALNPRLRLPIVLRYQEELSCAEIAEILDLSLSTIYTQLSEARQELRRLLGVELEEGPGE